MYRRFNRDPIVVRAADSKIKIEHPTDPGTFVSRSYTPDELSQLSPDDLAAALLDGYADVQKRDGLLAYAKAQFPSAADIRPLDDDFDRDVVGIIQLKFGGARVTVGFSRELWDRTETFEQLLAHMERNQWKETVNGASKQRAILGEVGWIEWE